MGILNQWGGRNFSLPFLNLFDNFAFKMMFVNSRRLFRACDQSIPWDRTWKFSSISYFTDLRQTRDDKKIPKTVLKTKLKTKETTYTLIFRKYIVVSFRSHSIRAFSVLSEDSLRIISGIWSAGKNPKTASDSASRN
jgi:hypothetical protein